MLKSVLVGVLEVNGWHLLVGEDIFSIQADDPLVKTLGLSKERPGNHYVFSVHDDVLKATDLLGNEYVFEDTVVTRAIKEKCD